MGARRRELLARSASAAGGTPRAGRCSRCPDAAYRRSQVSFEPPPRDELTSSPSAAMATRLSATSGTVTLPSSPARANTRRSTCRGSSPAGGQCRVRGEPDHLLRDEQLRVSLHLGLHDLEFLLADVRPDHHAGTAGAVDGLDDEFPEPAPDPLVLVGVGQHPGADIADQRLLAQVVMDHRVHEGVDRLVIGDAVPRGVRHRHRAGSGGRPQQRICCFRYSRSGDDLVVTEPAVQHIDRHHPTVDAGAAHRPHRRTGRPASPPARPSPQPAAGARTRPSSPDRRRARRPTGWSADNAAGPPAAAPRADHRPTDSGDSRSGQGCSIGSAAAAVRRLDTA